MKLKSSVKLNGIRPEVMVAMMVANDIFKEQSSELIITSVTDGKHMSGSLHYVGQAFDCRIRHLGSLELRAIVAALKRDLTAEFDVVLESTHIHIEFQPK